MYLLALINFNVYKLRDCNFKWDYVSEKIIWLDTSLEMLFQIKKWRKFRSTINIYGEIYLSYSKSNSKDRLCILLLTNDFQVFWQIQIGMITSNLLNLVAKWLFEFCRRLNRNKVVDIETFISYLKYFNLELSHNWIFKNPTLS